MVHTHPAHKSMFLAIELEPDVKQSLARILYLDLPKSQVRRQAQRDFHITLGFIRSVKWQDRSLVEQAFKPLERIPVLSLAVTGVVALGQFGQILCARFGPQEVIEDLSLEAGTLLTKHTEYQFDQSYAAYIPHTKIQTLKRNLPEALKTKILETFRGLPYKKIHFKARSLALMERKGRHYQTVKRYICNSSASIT
ncbi:MAG: hypothetical protein ABFQ95_06430 [Pseudomonadota bacterium]